MSLKKFEDFENHLAEEDKQALANDYVNATKQVLKFGDKITKIHPGKNSDEVIIEFWPSLELENVVLKVIGFEI